MSGKKYDITIIVADDGRIATDINLPHGEECDRASVRVRAAMVLAGLLPIEALDDLPVKVPSEDATAEAVRSKG